MDYCPVHLTLSKFPVMRLANYCEVQQQKEKQTNISVLGRIALVKLYSLKLRSTQLGAWLNTKSVMTYDIIFEQSRHLATQEEESAQQRGTFTGILPVRK